MIAMRIDVLSTCLPKQRILCSISCLHSFEGMPYLRSWAKTTEKEQRWENQTLFSFFVTRCVATHGAQPVIPALKRLILINWPPLEPVFRMRIRRFPRASPPEPACGQDSTSGTRVYWEWDEDKA